MRDYDQLLQNSIIIFLSVFFFYRAVIGEIDDEIDSGIEMTDMKAEPFNPVVY